LTLLPLGRLRFGWRSHVSALWWLGTLYRRPLVVRRALVRLLWTREIGVGFVLLLHAIPYVVALNLVLGLTIGFKDAIQYHELWLAPHFDFILFPIRNTAIGFVAGIVVGIVAVIPDGIAVGIAGGIAVVIAVVIAGGIAAGIAGGIASGIALGIAVVITGGIPGGIALAIVVGIVVGIALGIAVGIAGGIVVGIVVGIAGGIALGIAVGIAGGIAGGIALEITLLRAYYLIVHPLFLWPAPKGHWYGAHPVAWDDLCSIPFPGLDRLLAAYAEQYPTAGEQEIVRMIDTYPSQRIAALRAQVRLLARRMADETHLGRLDETAARLPEGERGFLAQTPRVRALIAEIASQQRHIDTTPRPIFREPLARALRSDIENFRNRVAGLNEPIASEFRAAAQRWLVIADEQWRQASTVIEREPTPQVFIAGNPVNREQEAFIPRNAVIGEIEAQIMLAAGCPGLVLYGRRRTGKSTTLRNLDGFLPTTVHVAYISMENPHAFTSLADLIRLGGASVASAWPSAFNMSPPDDLPSLFATLGSANDRLAQENRRLILAIDEYEYLDEKIGEGVFPLDLLATLRESIQTHHQITWLFAGSHDIGELTHAPWSSYLVSARTIEMPLFSEAETRLLLTEPLAHSPLFRNDEAQRPSFAAGLWGDEGIARIHAEAGGWPHLVQLLAETTVFLLNEGTARHADAALLDRAFAKAIVSGDTVLRQLVQGESRLPGEWDYVRGFRRHDTLPPPDDEAVYRSLRRRLLVVEQNTEWRLRVPLMQRWLRERG
jgi:hypothetical protein